MDEYKGYVTYTFQSQEELSAYYQQGTLPQDFPELVANEYVYFALNPDPDIIDKKRWDGEKLVEVVSRPIRTEFSGKIHALNPEQQLALDLLANDEITIKVLTGRFGSGKTYLMTTSAVEQVHSKKKFDRLIYLRNNVHVRDVPEIGFLPGGVNDKLMGYAMPMADALGGREALRYFVEAGTIEIVPLGEIRGRDFRNSLILCSECENLTVQHTQLIIGRVGEGSQVWFDGDRKQVDKKIFETNNGLVHMIDRLKGHPRFGYVQLQKTERSETAAMADLLD